MDDSQTTPNEDSPLSPTVAPADQTVSSLAYHTAEAIPNTVYYRNEENEGQSRPSLDTLRMGAGNLLLPSNTEDQQVQYHLVYGIYDMVLYRT